MAITKPLTASELKQWRRKNKIRRNFKVGDSNTIQKMLASGTAISPYSKGGKVAKKKEKEKEIVAYVKKNW